MAKCEGFRYSGHGSENRTRIEASAESETGLRRGSLFYGSAKARAQFMCQFALAVMPIKGDNFIPRPVASLCKTAVRDAKRHFRCSRHGRDAFEPGAIRRQLSCGKKYVAGNGVNRRRKLGQRKESFGLRGPCNAIAQARPVERAQAIAISDNVQFIFVRIENHPGKKAIDTVQ